MRRPLVALALALALPAPVLAGQVVVREGESLSEIADRHGISISRLIELNGIRNPNMVEAGSLLRIPGGSGGGSSSSSSSRSSGRSVASGGRIVVQEGDTLSEIASRHGVSMATLMKGRPKRGAAWCRRQQPPPGGPIHRGRSRCALHLQPTGPEPCGALRRKPLHHC